MVIKNVWFRSSLDGLKIHEALNDHSNYGSKDVQHVPAIGAILDFPYGKGYASVQVRGHRYQPCTDNGTCSYPRWDLIVELGVPDGTTIAEFMVLIEY